MEEKFEFLVVKQLHIDQPYLNCVLLNVEESKNFIKYLQIDQHVYLIL